MSSIVISEMMLTYLMEYAVDAWERSSGNLEIFDDTIINKNQSIEQDGLGGISLGELGNPRTLWPLVSPCQTISFSISRIRSF